MVTSRGGATEEVAGGAVLVDPDDPSSIAEGLAEPTEEEELRALGFARPRVQLGRCGRANARVYEAARAIVVDADFLGRGRTGDETYVDNLLRALVPLKGELEIAAIVRDASLVPAGITPLVLPPAHRSCGWRGRCRCGSRVCGPSSRTSSTRCRCSCERPRSSPSRT